MPDAYDIRECGECSARWNYGTPADRCPFEADHEPEEEVHDVAKLHTGQRLAVISITCTCGFECTSWAAWREHGRD